MLHEIKSKQKYKSKEEGESHLWDVTAISEAVYLNVGEKTNSLIAISQKKKKVGHV